MEKNCKTCQYYDKGKCTFYIWYPKGKGKGVIDKKESDSCIYHKANKTEMERRNGHEIQGNI